MKPPSFVYVEIKTNSRIPTTPFVVQPITKLVSPLVSQHVEGSERFDKE
jgi:hypothetical protein